MDFPPTNSNKGLADLTGHTFKTGEHSLILSRLAHIELMTRSGRCESFIF